MTTETCRRWNAVAGEWETMTVEITPEPRRRARSRTRSRRRQGSPRDLAGLSAGSPLPAWWRDTAYAPSDGFADMRTYVKPSAIRTHRAAIAAPASDSVPTRGQVRQWAGDVRQLAPSLACRP